MFPSPSSSFTHLLFRPIYPPPFLHDVLHLLPCSHHPPPPLPILSSIPFTHPLSSMMSSLTSVFPSPSSNFTHLLFRPIYPPPFLHDVLHLLPCSHHPPPPLPILSSVPFTHPFSSMMSFTYFNVPITLLLLYPSSSVPFTHPLSSVLFTHTC